MNIDSMERLLRAVCITAAGLVALSSAGTALSAGVSRQIHSVGSGIVNAVSPGSDAIANPEIDDAMMVLEGHDDLGTDTSGGAVVNRSIAQGPGGGVPANSGKKAKSNPQMQLSFDAINFRQQRLANGGNQFSVEPPDQGLCVGNGYVLEVVNTVLRVFDSNGNALTGVADLNTFYGYPAAINRVTGVRGPEITDPSCYYDADTQRWFLLVVTLDRVPGTNSLSGHNHLDLAVSTSASPLGAWTIYQIDTTGDGSDAGSGIACDPNPTPGFHGFYVFACVADYPHLGFDANGIYLSTNSFPFFFGGFNGAQLYAFPKQALASGAAVVTGQHFDTANYLLAGAAPGFPNGTPGFTVWPAISPSGSYATDQNGTEYLLSSQAVFNDSGADNRLRVWALTNTASLNSVPAVQLVNGVVNTQDYAVPPLSNQKAGDWPLGQCLNNTACATFLNGGADPFAPEPFPTPDSNDSRMQQVSFANGKLWGALDTAVNMGGPDKAGIAYFVMIPQLSGTSIKAKMVIQGILALQNNNLTYPAVAVLPNGRGVMAFTILGDDYYPSAGFASLDALVGAGDIQVAAAGVGPDDGFSAYEFYNAPNPIRTRWGDYGAAVVDGNTIWMASEYINQTCTLAQYLTPPVGSCGGTRTSLGNWSTRITRVKP
jgi:hypothetical protein